MLIGADHFLFAESEHGQSSRIDEDASSAIVNAKHAFTQRIEQTMAQADFTFKLETFAFILRFVKNKVGY